MQLNCPTCKAVVVTSIRDEPSNSAYICCMMMCIFGYVYKKYNLYMYIFINYKIFLLFILTFVGCGAVLICRFSWTTLRMSSILARNVMLLLASITHKNFKSKIYITIVSIKKYFIPILCHLIVMVSLLY